MNFSMTSVLLHGTTLKDVQKQLNEFLKTKPTIIKMAQCLGHDPHHKEIDFVLTIVYKPGKKKAVKKN